MHKKSIKFGLGLALLALLLTGCSMKDVPLVGKFLSGKQPAKPGEQAQAKAATSSLTQQLADQSKIKKFDSLAELKEFMSRSNGGGSLDAFSGGRGAAAPMMAKTMMAESAAVSNGIAADGAVNNQAANADFSKTNNQVEGVDEPDIIKTDGKYIYAVTGNTLYIFNAEPDEQIDIISKTEFKSMPQDIFINENRLAVFGQDYSIEPMAATDSSVGKMIAPSLMPVRRPEITYFKVYDITDKARPELVQDLAFEGNYRDSRMIGDYVYFVTNAYSSYADQMPVPRIMDKGEFVNEEPSIYYFDLPYYSYNFTRVSAINLKDAGARINSQIYLLNDAQNLFVSQGNLYVTYTKYLSEEQLAMAVTRELLLPRLDAGEQAKILKIDATDDYILSPAEKLAKAGAIINRFVASLPIEQQLAVSKELEQAIKAKYQVLAKELEKTVIHKIAINKDRIEYRAVGEVPGQVLNQFSMDESSGFFRIATTKNQTWSRFAEEAANKSYSNMYVLDENMRTVGSLEKLAEGERIYSARFMGNRAYLVTFQQTDPLFAIDLTEPTAPKVLGELKIPGFSSYLHPYDDTTLIGLGRETEPNQWGGATVLGLKLSLFDVAEVGAPKELATYSIGGRGSDSEALNDAHAFLFSKEKNLLVIPASIREGGNRSEWGRFTFSGALIFDLAGKQLKLRGRVDHSDGGQAGISENWYGHNFYDNTVRRSLYINQNLYTLSSRYLRANKLSDLSLVKTLKLSNKITIPAPVPMQYIDPMPVKPSVVEDGSGSTGSVGVPVDDATSTVVEAVPAEPYASSSEIKQ